jgi:hypothetical protein
MIRIPSRKAKLKKTGQGMPKKFIRRPMSQRYIESRERAQRALVMKRAGFSWTRICEELGYRREASAFMAVKRLLQRSARLETEDMVQLHMERTENMLNKLERGIVQGNPRSVEVGVKVLERQARLLGLDYEDRKEQAPEGARIEINILADPRDDDARRFLDEIKSRATPLDGAPVHSPLLPPAEGDSQH